MEYIKKTLTGVVGNDLCALPLFEFLQEVSSESPQQDQVRNLSLRWKGKLHSSVSGIVLCYVSGFWMPKISSLKELRRQASWADFGLKRFGTSFPSNSTIGSQESSTFQPSNFTTLLKLALWSELYQLCGVHVTTFIFDKCLILFPLEECFYHCIGPSNSLLQKKIQEYEELGFVKRFSSDPKNPKTIASSSVSSFDPFVSSKATKNCYAITPLKQDAVIADANSSKRRKRKSEISDMNLNLKRRRLGNPIICKFDLLNIKEPEEAPRNPITIGEHPVENIPSTTTSRSRWITPNPEILQRIRLDRERLKKLRGVESSNSNTAVDNDKVINQPTFLSILHNKYFKGKLEFISKEVHEIIPSSLTAKTYPKLAGLRLPSAMANSTEKVQIVVHRMSEWNARKWKLNVKPRKRRHQRKKSKAMERTIATPTDDAEEADKNDQIVQNPNWQPFDPTVPLSTVDMLFKKSAGNAWPTGSHMKNACSATVSLQAGTRYIQKKILDFSICAKSHAQTVSTLALLAACDFGRLEVILKRMVLFHRMVKNINLLIRNIVSFWGLKLKQILAQREKKKLDKWKIKSTISLKSDSLPNEVEIIDLTADTPSDTSTCFSISLIDASKSFEVSSEDPNPPAPVHQALTNSQNEFAGSAINKKLKKVKPVRPAPLREPTPPSIILSALSQILRLSGGLELLGSNRNRKGFFRFLRKSIFLAGVHSSLHLGQLMALLDPAGCQWLDGIQNPALKMHLLAKVVSWLFSEYVLNFLKVGFYATDVNHSRLQSVFFLRNVWKSLSDRVRDQYLKSKKLCRIYPRQGSAMISPNAVLRHIPKKNNQVRPIMALSQEVKDRMDLPKCLLLLNYLMMNISPHAGSDVSILRTTWLKFLTEWKTNKCPPLYFIKVDIRDAYPSVCIEKLTDILEKATNGEKLTIKRIHVLGGGKKRIKLSLAKASSSPSQGNTGRNWYSSIIKRPCILQDTNQDKPFNATQVLSQILNTLASNIVRIGKHNFTFSNGLPQGWALSSALCNIYYGHMEHHYFSEFMNNQGEFFVRTIDDYFYVSPNADHITSFFQKMKAGIPEYHCTINPDKSLSNIAVVNSDQSSAEKIEQLYWVPYCGWRFCLKNGHVARDLASYANQDICFTLTFNLRKRITPEGFIYTRMGIVIPARLKSLVLDPTINCRERILCSLFDAGLMFAFRFYALCRVVYPNLNVMSDRSRVNKLVEAIAWCAKRLNRFVRRTNIYLYGSAQEQQQLHACSCGQDNRSGLDFRNLQQSMENNAPKPTDPIRDAEVYFIVYHAFSIKFQKHCSAFQEHLLPIILRKRSVQMKRLGQPQYDHLVKVIGLEMPEHFANMKI